MSAEKAQTPSKQTEELEGDTSIFLIDESSFDEADESPKKGNDTRVDESSELSSIDSTAAQASVEHNSEKTDTKKAPEASYKQDTLNNNLAKVRVEKLQETLHGNTQLDSIDRKVPTWPIDESFTPEEYQKLPQSLRDSLVEASYLPNGLTHINLVESKQFSSKELALSYIADVSEHEGFTVSLKQEGDRTHAYCNQKALSTSNSLKRQHPEDDTSKICSFHAILQKQPEGNQWELQVKHAEHGHGPQESAASAKRRRLTQFQKLSQVDLPLPDSIKSELTVQNSETPDNSNAAGLKSLVGALRFENALLTEELDAERNVTQMFWTTADCMDMLKQYPEVLFINFTKSADMPTLVHVVGITSLNTTFEVGYAFIKSTDVSDFRWMLLALKTTASSYFDQEYLPSAVLTHRESSLIAAVDTVFENTGQVCLSQLTRDVYERSLGQFQDPKDQAKFMKHFQELVDSETSDIYMYNHSDFNRKYSKTSIFDYITQCWLVYKNKFVRAWADQHMHFNNYSMGKAVITQKKVKQFADESKGDFLKLLGSLTVYLATLKKEHEALLQKETRECALKFYVPFYDDVRFKISSHALEMIKEQHEMYLEAMSSHEPLHRCTRMFTTTTGLPCKHTLSRPVTMDDLHPHWWLIQQKALKEAVSESDRLANELNYKFERTMHRVKEHFLNYASLESREFMLMNMIKYFSKAGVNTVDYKSLYGITSPTNAGTRGNSPALTRGKSPAPNHTEVLPPQPPTGVPTETSAVAAATKIKTGLLAQKPSFEGKEIKISSPQIYEDDRHETEAATDLYATTTRRCGKCNQVGHNSRTCGNRISLQGV